MALKDENLEYIEEEFNNKSAVLESFGEEVTPATFYEDIFGDLETIAPFVFLEKHEGEKVSRMTLDEAIMKASFEKDMLVSATSFFKNFYSSKTIKDIYAFVIDLDNIYSRTLNRALDEFWQDHLYPETNYPKPTYIVNSGTGLHLYFVLDKPLSCYKKAHQDITFLYKELIDVQSRRNFAIRQNRCFEQPFRMVGSLNKYNWKIRAFRVGNKWNIDELAYALEVNTPYTVEKGYTEEYIKAKIKKRSSGEPSDKRSGSPKKWYHDTVEKCRLRTKEGNRYMSMCSLTCIAYKCNISLEALEQDLLSLIPTYNEFAKRIIKEDEIYSAMLMYNEKALTVRAEILEDWQGWKFDRETKRNGRNQREHLEEIRAVRDVRMKRQNKKWTDSNGRPSAAAAVKKYREENPEARKIDCHRDTGLSRPTIQKWWNIQDEKTRAGI